MNRLICTLACLLVSCRFACGQSPSGPIDQEWRSYGHDPGGMRFSPLKQIDRSNVGQLRRLWTCHTGETNWNSIRAGHISAYESTPLMVDSVLYFSTPASRVIALDGETGKEIWIFDPFSDAQTRRTVQNRGVAYWEGNSPVTCSGRARRTDKRIFYGTLDGRLFALDAQTGKPCNGFGNRGAIDLRKGVADGWPKAQYDVTSPPAIYRDLVITGAAVQEYPSKGPSGAVRAFDVRTGKLVWTFDTVPQPGQLGHETWEGDGWRDRSGTNVWSIMSVDTEHGMIFLPIGSPSYDFYGADRRGQNLFGNSLVALDAATGKLIWYFQMVHHDLWDHDPPAPPSLITVRQGGREIPVVVQVTKMGFVFVLDRLTGKPLFPIEERAVLPSKLPGEAAWPTQPFPVKQPPWGTLNAVNLNTGEIAWKVPLGVVDELEAKGIPKTGVPNLGGSIATAGGLVFIAGTNDKRFRAFDSNTGKELWVIRLEANGHATPMTFLGKRTHKQIVVIAAGGSGLLATEDVPIEASDTLAAFALPDK